MAGFTGNNGDLRHVLEARFNRAYRRRVGKGREWSVIALSDETGIDQRTIREYMNDRTLPNLDKFLAIARVLGADFLNEVLEGAGFEGARDGGDADENPHIAGASVSALMLQMHVALSDGKYDASEKRETLELARRSANALMSFIAGLEMAIGGEHA
ncbi:helix-turn-helix domain-containing protein [Thalassospira marina]|uniref:HTH cro/C1-type domain-containing protein n=1 Tax=Thalassospira marina TaxID=2048283 RepID=A0A2N3KSP9_9PROT|nr:helix-turn-helix transcriptional regulator [Thalassospira marina]PKR53540.1 hypothetical protein COO20_13450 [Thalassospira marina]